MGFSKFQPLSTLKVKKYNSIIRVRVQALWRGVSRSTQEFRGINMILLDDSSDRIHAFVSAKYATLFEGELHEGEIISLQNFTVKEYVGDENNGTLRNEKHIYLSNETKLQKDHVDGLKIPKFAFDIFNLEDLRKIYNDNRFLVDVIGVLNNVGGKTLFKKENEDRFHVKFEITNGRSNVPVTFFGDLGDDFQKVRKQFLQEPVIIIICCAKVNEWNDHYSVKCLMKRANEPSFITTQALEVEKDIKYILYVNAIKKLDKAHEGKTATCEITVRRVEETANWFFNKCTKCPKELIFVEGNFYCDDCKRNIPYPNRRFRILALCSDDTGMIPIIFPDHEIKKLIGKTVFELRLEDDKVFPNILTQLENKKYTITLEISEENILKTCDAYTSTEICPIMEFICSPTKFETEEEEVQDTSMLIVVENQPIDPNLDTPTTNYSTTKGKVRKLVDDEHVPLGVFKNKRNSRGRELS